MLDLWIGDAVKLISSGKTGIYEGLFNNKAKIKTRSGYVFTDPEDIRVIPESEISEEIIEPKKPKTPLIKHKEKKEPNDPIIDLHIEKLNPAMKNAVPELILNYQLRRAESFLNDIIKRRHYRSVIIHGKGQGALKMEIEHLVKNYDELNYFKSINEGGAIEVFFSYF